MRQADFLPCEHKKWFFCSNGLTNGIAHIDKDSICSDRWYPYSTGRMHWPTGKVAWLDWLLQDVLL
jgi:hypothetical protein